MNYFIHATSFAAPFCSDDSTGYVVAESPEEALQLFASMYSHPCGFFCANVWESADDWQQKKKPLAQWQSNRLRAELKAKGSKSCYSFCGHGPDQFEIDGELFNVNKPKAGKVVYV